MSPISRCTCRGSSGWWTDPTWDGGYSTHRLRIASGQGGSLETEFSQQAMMKAKRVPRRSVRSAPPDLMGPVFRHKYAAISRPRTRSEWILSNRRASLPRIEWPVRRDRQNRRAALDHATGNRTSHLHETKSLHRPSDPGGRSSRRRCGLDRLIRRNTVAHISVGAARASIAYPALAGE
jgi:hypothetical protein